jgi:NAD(P)-dependent dehydrogenase (short-subunit alcohol dehydrogenase family)
MTTTEPRRADQRKSDDPRHPDLSPPEQHQESVPALQREMDPVPDIGEESYRGTGRLEGRRALITGADSGIGAAVALAFAREGADVALSYLPSEQPDADHVIRLIEDAGGRAVALPADLVDSAACVRLVQSAIDGLGGLDLLVNNAAKQSYTERLEDLSDRQFEETMRVNVFAMFWITKAALPHLGPGSTIINTTSHQAYEPSPTLLDYALTKAAINNFSKGLAQQLAPRGIRVNAVAPGPVWTPLQVSEGQDPPKLPEFGQSTPLGRPAQPAEVAPAFVFLASGESSFVVGETLGVTGGMLTP